MTGKLKTTLVVTAALMAASAARADVIDFNSAPDNVASMTIDGVTFTPNNGPGSLYTTTFGNDPNGTPGLVAWNGTTFPDIRADIAGGARFVSVDLGDYDADEDHLYLIGYMGSNVLGVDTFDFPASRTGMQTLFLSSSGNNIFDHVVFGGIGVEGSSVYADNFTFSLDVPEPATWSLMIGGFGLAGASLRRRRTIAA